MELERKWSLIQQKALNQCLASIFDQFKNQSLDAVCFKGWSLARFYPENRLRSYNDIDIIVSPADYGKTLRIIRSLPFKSVSVDVHGGIRDRDTLSFEELFSRSYLAKLDDIDVRVLGDEDNLRITSAHWLIDGGVFKEKLWDIYYLVSNRAENFDWSRCIDAPGPIRRTWVLTAVATARDYLGLDVSGLPNSLRKFELPNWYRRTLDREWARDPKPRIPLLSCLKQPDLFVKQVRHRFPPNPIAATTDTEGPIDDSWRVPYQIKSIVKKLRNAPRIGR